MDTSQVVERIQGLQHLPGALLPILHALQEEFGYIDDAMIPLIAEALNISHAEVHGVISFYHDFRRAPAGKHVLQICRAESCQAMGCNSLVAHVEKNLGVKMGETTKDNRFTLLPIVCLGTCDRAPAMLVDQDLHRDLEDISEQSLGELLDGYK